MGMSGRGSGTGAGATWGGLAAALRRFRVALASVVALAVFEGVLFASGLLDAIAALLLLPMGLVLVLAAGWLVRAAGGASWSMRFGMRHLMMFVALAAVAFQLMRTFGWSLLTLAVLMTPPLVGLAAYLLLMNRREVQRDALVSVLAMAARRGMPLGPAARAYAGLCSGAYRVRVERLAGKLDRGEPLPGALDDVRGVAPREASALARAGWGAGTLAPALEEAASARAARRRNAPPTRALIAYPLLIVYVVIASGIFLERRMGTRMAAILSDMGVERPAIGRSLEGLFRPVGDAVEPAFAMAFDASPTVSLGWFGELVVSFLVAVPVFAALAAIGALGLWMARRLARGAGAGVDAVAGVATGRRPMASRLAPPRVKREAATVLRALSQAVDAGRPLSDALADLGRRDVSLGTRRRVRRVRGDLVRGRDWIDALRDRGLVRSGDAAVLATARRAGNLGWAMRERADAIERRLDYRIRAWGQVLQPAAIVALGGLVLVFGLVYFQSLVAMIAHLAEDVA